MRSLPILMTLLVSTSAYAETETPQADAEKTTAVDTNAKGQAQNTQTQNDKTEANAEAEMLKKAAQEAKAALESQPTMGTPGELPILFSKIPQLEWVEVQGGEFQMGHPKIEGSLTQKMTVKSFFITKSEVTVAQYRACINAGACSEPENPESSFYLGDDLPISGISPLQALNFAQFVGARLPTEVEWEFAACDRGQQKLFPWGNLGFMRKMAPHEDQKIGRSKSGKPLARIIRPHEVCSTRRDIYKNELGLCDMGGNLAEWVSDVHEPDLDHDDLVIRGGSMIDPPLAQACAARMVLEKDYWKQPTDHDTHADTSIGFRLVKDASH